MIFHEIYGCYYRTVAKAICLAQKGELTEKRLTVPSLKASLQSCPP